jgi:hypothetical protein
MHSVRPTSGPHRAPSLATANSSLSVGTRERGRNVPRDSGVRAGFSREALNELFRLRDMLYQISARLFPQGAPLGRVEIIRHKSDKR